MTENPYPTEDKLPWPGGKLLAFSQCGSGLWVVLAHWPKRGQWWAFEGEFWCFLYNPAAGCYLSGIQTSQHLKAVDTFTDRLKHNIRRYIDGDTTTEE